MLYWLANNNFGHHTKRFIEEGIWEFKPNMFLRRLQCDIFGHDWFCYLRDNGWCAWCSRIAGRYPKMRVRKPENGESIKKFTKEGWKKNVKENS